MDQQVTVEVEGGLEILKDFYRTHLLKFLKSISAPKQLIIDSTLINLVTDLLETCSQCKVVGVAQLKDFPKV